MSESSGWWSRPTYALQGGKLAGDTVGSPLGQALSGADVRSGCATGDRPTHLHHVGAARRRRGQMAQGFVQRVELLAAHPALREQAVRVVAARIAAMRHLRALAGALHRQAACHQCGEEEPSDEPSHRHHTIWCGG